MRKNPVVVLLLGVLLACVLSACGGGGGGGTTTAPAAIQFGLSTDKTNLLSDNADTATITATFVSDVANGTGVTFSIPANTAVLAVPGSTTTGTQVTATTTSNKAAVTIKGSNLSIPVVVTATSGSITKTIPINFSSNVSANAAVTSVAPNNPVTINILSTVTAAGNLTVATSPSAGVDIVQPTAGAGAGQFTATVTPHVLGPITVTVTNTVSNSTSTVTFDSKTQIPMSVSPAGNVFANGIDTATVTADFTGITIADNEPVTFSATNGAILSTTQALTSGGKATVTVTSSTAGTSQVTASYKGSAGSTNVVFVKPQFAITASKNTALANNADMVTLTVTLTGVADTTVTLAASPTSATLGNTSVTTSGGTATTTVKSGTAGPVTVTASFGTSTATTTVTFITQPTAMDVFIALNPAQPSLASLQFVLNTDAGATVPPTATVVNAAATGSFVAVGPGSAANTTNVALINATGFNTMTAPIIKLTYAITGSGLPGAQINSTAPITALNAALQPITLTPQNFVLTTEYR